jgi:NitT/TauT family transport system substrate-binding protein
VTCHLTCPVTDYISHHVNTDAVFIPKMFQGFPEIKEALIANKMQAAFIVAPMAMALKAQGVPVKIVYLGHRYGTAVVVKKDGPIHSIADLRGRIVAIPTRFSDERFLVRRALGATQMTEADIQMVEMAPPDVAGALAAGAIDAFSMAEPFPSQAELGGYGRVLFFAKEYWPDYISCVLVVREDMIAQRPEDVQALVDGIARSGLWLDKGAQNREYAADFVGRYYYHQRPEVLRHALTKPLDRVMFNPLTPARPDFEMIMDMLVEAKLVPKRLAFEDYIDVRFAEKAHSQMAWDFGAAEATPESK